MNLACLVRTDVHGHPDRDQHRGKRPEGPVKVWDELPEGLVLAADPQVTVLCSGGGGANVLYSDLVQSPANGADARNLHRSNHGSEGYLRNHVPCRSGAGFEGDTLINRGVVEAWC